jgi:motility quorum-sensing regulator/GCU-specific mRNA interferase toxin
LHRFTPVQLGRIVLAGSTVLPSQVVQPRGGPTYDLAVIQQLVSSGSWTATHTAFADATALLLDRHDIADCICCLTAADFYKTMESDKVPGIIFDVYRPAYEGLQIYLKFKVTDAVVVVSFKQDESA